MAYITYIEKFKKGNDEYNIKAASAETAIVADRAITADTVDSIGNVRKYSGVDGGKQREGLYFTNNSGEGSEAVVELNSKGNFSIKSLTKHLNLESKKGIQIKPTATLTLDSTRRIIEGKGNEIQVEARFDDFGEVTGYKGADEKWAELKINSRNLDLRCHEHGGIALQIAGKDSDGNENKIKFESDRTNSISETGTYNGEGGKGLEFGTFNNLHSSLYTGDYRFMGNGMVYGVFREAPVQTETGKWDYPTQSDDFKDPIDSETPRATWKQIIEAANKCKNKDAIASEEYVDSRITERIVEIEGGGEISLDGYATKEYVQTYVNEHGTGGNYTAGSGVHIEDGIISVNNYSNIEPLTALTDNVGALNDIKFGKGKGNFSVDVKGKYTWELTSPKNATSVDEYGVEHVKGDRVVNYSDESFYTDENKYYYKAEIDTTMPDNSDVLADTIVYNAACNITFNEDCGYSHYEMGEGDETFYEDDSKYVYKGTKNVSILYGETTPITKKKILNPSELSSEEIAYYDSQTAVYDEESGNLISGWEKTPIWKKSTLWSMNEININLETDSKIKFDGKKIETCWGEDENENPIKMAEILLSSENIAADATCVTFEQKISKNGDRSGQDTEIAYIFGNNVADTEKVPDLATFMANYRSKHSGTYTDEELTEKYNAFLAEGESFEIRVKVSELLGLVSKVAELEARIAALENQ